MDDLATGQGWLVLIFGNTLNLTPNGWINDESFNKDLISKREFLFRLLKSDYKQIK